MARRSHDWAAAKVNKKKWRGRSKWYRERSGLLLPVAPEW
jgi:hypothetical protein